MSETEQPAAARLNALSNVKTFLAMGQVVDIKGRRFLVVGLQRKAVALRLLPKEGG